jgi:MscS family membrane protein
MSETNLEKEIQRLTATRAAALAGADHLAVPAERIQAASWSIKILALVIILGAVLLLGLAACVPSQVTSTAEPSGALSVTQTTAPAEIIAPTQSSPVGQAAPEEQQPEQDSDQLLVVPTLAPTATPGMIYTAVQQAVEATDLEETRFLGLQVADWINLAISLLLVVLTLTLIAGVIFFILKSIARRTATPYDDIYLDSIRPYLRWLFGVIILYIATIRLQFLSPFIKHWLVQFYYVLIVGLIGIGLWKLVDVLILWYQEKGKDQGERGSKEAVLLLGEHAVRTLIILVGLIMILDRLGFNISALLATIGIGGLALSLAAKDTIANMISGVIILIDQPFRVGDRIEIQELKTWGDVVSIGLRSTRIRTLDNRMVIVPNSGISNNQVVNYTYPDPRYRIQTEIGVAYGTDLRVVRQVITDALRGVEGVLADKPVDVLFLEFGDSDMVLRVRWWIESYIDARRSTDRVNEAMYTALAQASIELPNPQMTVELKPKD